MIRRAAAADVFAAYGLARHAFRHRDDRISLPWLVERLASPGVSMWVDPLSACVVRGFMLLERYGGETVVRMIATDPAFRGFGVASGLLARVRGRAFAWVRQTNTASNRLFASAGWSASSERVRRGGWVYYVRSRSTRT